jgi:two-component system response regulator YesN
MKQRVAEKNETTFIKLFLSYIIVILIPIILISIITISFLFTKLANDTRKLNLNVLKQFENIVNFNLGSVMTVLYQIQESENVNRMLTSSYIDHGERVYHMWEVTNDIRLYLANNPILENAGVYFSKYNFIIDRFSTYTLDEYYHKYLMDSDYTYEMWVDKIRNGPSRGFFITAKTENDFGIMNTLLYCQNLKHSQEGDMVTIAVINLDRIIGNLESVGIDADWSFAVVDRDGNFIIKTNNFENEVNLDINLDGEFESEDGIIIYRKSDVIDLKYIYLFPKGGLSGSVRFVAIIFAFSILFGFLFSVVVAGINTKRMYLPFLKLSDEKNMLIQELDKQVENMREQILLNLLYGIGVDDIDPEELKNKYHIQFKEDKICVILAGISKTDGLENYISQDAPDEFWHKVNNGILDILKEAGVDYETVWINNSQFVYILNYADSTLLENTLFDILQTFKTKYNLFLNIGVGHEVDSLCEISRSYSGAGLAFRYGFSEEQGGIIYYVDIKNLESVKTYYTNEKELALIRNVKSGSRANVDRIFDEIYRINFCDMHLSHDAMRWLINQISLTIYKILSETNIGDAEKIEKFNRVSKNIMRNEDVEECFEILREVCLSLCIDADKSSENSAFKEEVIRYLKENYWDSSLSLDSLADHMNVSYYSLSRWFKEFMGDTFVNYLTTIRLEKAKELLINTDASVKQICERTGFNDSSSFIRVFKKFCSITPIQYRKAKAKKV